MMKSLIIAALAGLGCASAAGRAASDTAQPPINTAETEIVSDRIADSLLVDVRALDSGIVVDLRYATANNFTGAPLPGYLANRAYLRLEAASALASVQRALNQRGLGLKVFDAYRPARATQAMVDWTARANRTDLLKDGYIAGRSRHNLGLAIDVTLIELPAERELEMGTPFDTFSSASHTANASGQVAINRQLLKAAMERDGFASYEQEWWHFSFSVPDPLRFDRPVR